MKPLVLALLAIAACGDDGSPASPPADAAPAPPIDAAPIDAAPAPTVPPQVTFDVTSTAFAAGAAIPTDNTCNGANTSPPLAWARAPAASKSFAIVLSDKSFNPPLIHWVIYDIAATTTAVPAAIENSDTPASVPGAIQLQSLQSTTIGYSGPCPPKGTTHAYEFGVYALDVAHLPGVTKDSSRDAAVLALQSHALLLGQLDGTYTAPK